MAKKWTSEDRKKASTEKYAANHFSSGGKRSMSNAERFPESHKRKTQNENKKKKGRG